MRFVVTGGAGFIGSHYVRSLLLGAYAAEPTRVTVLDKLTYAGNLANLAPVADDPRLTVAVGDVADPEFVARTVTGHDVVVHFAAETHVDRSIADPMQFTRTNVVGTHTLLQACVDAGITKTVLVSTDEVYGSVDHGSLAEDAPLLPSSPYSASKAAADLLARAFWRTFDLDVSIARCSNCYGPYQFPEKLIPRFVTDLLDGRRVPLYGDGSNVRNWLHVDDAGRGIHEVVERGSAGEVYNVGDGCEISNRDLTGLLLDACGADWDSVEHVPDRKAHDQRYSIDSAKLARLGWAPTVPFARGLAETVTWYAENRPWWEPLREQDAPTR